MGLTKRYYDTHPYDIQHNDTQHNNKNTTPSIKDIEQINIKRYGKISVLNVVKLSVALPSKHVSLVAKIFIIVPDGCNYCLLTTVGHWKIVLLSLILIYILV